MKSNYYEIKMIIEARYKTAREVNDKLHDLLSSDECDQSKRVRDGDLVMVEQETKFIKEGHEV